MAPAWQRRLLRRIPWGVRRLIDAHHWPRYCFVRDAAAAVGPGDVVLDAGAGECPYRALFAHARYVAVDNGVGSAEWDYSGIDVAGDLFALPFRPGAVRHILCNDVLEHVPEPQRLLDAFFAVLAPGGSVFLSAPQGWGEHQLPHDYFRFTSRGLALLFERAGFRVDFIRPLGGFFSYLANRVQMVPLVLFAGRRGAARVALLPLEALAHLVCGVLLPLLLLPLDRFDHERLTTLTYGCRAVKPIEAARAAA